MFFLFTIAYSSSNSRNGQEPPEDRNGQNGPPSPSRPPFPRIRLPLFLGGILLGLLASGLVILAFRERLPPLSAEALAAAEARWTAAGIRNYDLDLELGGTWPGQVRVEVRDGVVKNMTRDGQTPRRQSTWDIWSVPGQFETLQRELELAENPTREMQTGESTRLLLRASFHPHYGYPVHYRRLVVGDGPDVSWDTVRLTPLPDASQTDNTNQ